MATHLQAVAAWLGAVWHKIAIGVIAVDHLTLRWKERIDFWKQFFKSLKREDSKMSDPAVIAKLEADLKAAVGIVEGQKIDNPDSALKLVSSLLQASPQLLADANGALTGPDRDATIAKIVSDMVSIPDCPPFLEYVGLRAVLTLGDRVLGKKFGTDWPQKLEAAIEKIV